MLYNYNLGTNAPIPSECVHEGRSVVHFAPRDEKAGANYNHGHFTGYGEVFPGDFAQTGQVCPVSPRVIWRNVTAQHAASTVDGVPLLVPWLAWLPDLYARTCWGLPAVLHVAVDLALILHARIWAQVLYLRSCCSDQ